MKVVVATVAAAVAAQSQDLPCQEASALPTTLPPSS